MNKRELENHKMNKEILVGRQIEKQYKRIEKLINKHKRVGK